MQGVSIPMRAMDSGSNEKLPAEVLTAAIFRTSTTLLAAGISSAEAVSLNTSATSTVVEFPVGEGLKNRLPS